jgi:hypothetical protein
MATMQRFSYSCEIRPHVHRYLSVDARRHASGGRKCFPSGRHPLRSGRLAHRQRGRRERKQRKHRDCHCPGWGLPGCLRSDFARVRHQGHRAPIFAFAGTGGFCFVRDHVWRHSRRTLRRLSDRPDRTLSRLHGRHAVLRGRGHRGGSCAERLGTWRSALSDGLRCRPRSAGGDGVSGGVFTCGGQGQQGGKSGCGA